MLKVEQNTGCEAVTDVIVSDTRAAVAAIDDALLTHAQLFVTTLQAARAHSVRIGTSQRLYSSFDQSMQGILESRKAMTESIAMLQVIARSKGVEERLEGCADGFPQGFTTPFLGQRADEAVAPC